MKRYLALSAFAFLVSGLLPVAAQEKTVPPPAETPAAPVQTAEWYLMRGDRIIRMPAGTPVPAEQEVTLGDGTRVQPDGTVIRSNGDRMLLYEGDRINQLGEVTGQPAGEGQNSLRSGEAAVTPTRAEASLSSLSERLQLMDEKMAAMLETMRLMNEKMKLLQPAATAAKGKTAAELGKLDTQIKASEDRIKALDERIRKPVREPEK